MQKKIHIIFIGLTTLLLSHCGRTTTANKASSSSDSFAGIIPPAPFLVKSAIKAPSQVSGTTKTVAYGVMETGAPADGDLPPPEEMAGGDAGAGTTEAQAAEARNFTGRAPSGALMIGGVGKWVPLPYDASKELLEYQFHRLDTATGKYIEEGVKGFYSNINPKTGFDPAQTAGFDIQYGSFNKDPSTEEYVFTPTANSPSMATQYNPATKTWTGGYVTSKGDPLQVAQVLKDGKTQSLYSLPLGIYNPDGTWNLKWGETQNGPALFQSTSADPQLFQRIANASANPSGVGNTPPLLTESLSALGSLFASLFTGNSGNSGGDDVEYAISN